MGKFDRFAFSAHAAFDEPAVRQAFAQAVPLKTVVIYCYDPRAAQIPCAVAKRFGETFPGELVVNEHGLKIASTTTLFPVVRRYRRPGRPREEQHSDISQTFPAEALCIADYEQSLRSDVKLLRDHPATPRSANIFGFFYEIDSGELIEIVKDAGSGR